ncbi:MAG: peptidoglycan D,D-transpeptidase FtsI family protein, partial [Gammaproteobacteria bacterium]
VLAMVNQPSYNPNNRGKFKASQTRNRAATDLLEPGSTIKPFTVVAALESGQFGPTSIVDTSPGQFHLGKAVIRDTRNYGRISVAKVIQKSSNVGASKIALALSDEALWKVHARLGFGNATGSGFPGEAGGLLSHARHWRDIEKATLAFGYGLSVTPLQLARAYSVLAADGVLKPITFLRTDGRVEGQRIISTSIAQQVRHMLEAVVQDGGTGTRARIAGYRVAGKTGTVKKAVAGGYSEDRYISVFAGLAPASQPRLAMVVVINDPRGDVYYGGEVAAPVFSKVMAGALRMLGVTPDNVSKPALALAALTPTAGGHP